MRTLLIFAICTLSVFTAIALACAVWIALRRPAPASRDPYFHPIGDVPGFTDQQLREITRRSMTRIEQDAQRRSFAYGNVNLSNPRVTRAMVDQAASISERRHRLVGDTPRTGGGRGGETPPAFHRSAGDALRPDADGVGHPHHSPRVHAVRNFFAAWLHKAAT